jgi:hypothetical protein
MLKLESSVHFINVRWDGSVWFLGAELRGLDKPRELGERGKHPHYCVILSSHAMNQKLLLRNQGDLREFGLFGRTLHHPLSFTGERKRENKSHAK